MSPEIMLNASTLALLVAQISILARWTGKVDTRLDNIEARQDRKCVTE